jgi:hypothetical protein
MSESNQLKNENSTNTDKGKKCVGKTCLDCEYYEYIFGIGGFCWKPKIKKDVQDDRTDK